MPLVAKLPFALGGRLPFLLFFDSVLEESPFFCFWTPPPPPPSGAMTAVFLLASPYHPLGLAAVFSLGLAEFCSFFPASSLGLFKSLSQSEHTIRPIFIRVVSLLYRQLDCRPNRLFAASTFKPFSPISICATADLPLSVFPFIHRHPFARFFFFFFFSSILT